MSTKTKMHKTMKLPENLPPPPPVPDGYGAWEYVQELSGVQNAPWTRLQSDDTWYEFTGFNGTFINPVEHGAGRHCIRAVNHPAPAKKKVAKPTGKSYNSVDAMIADLSKKQPKAKAVKAVRGFARGDFAKTQESFFCVRKLKSEAPQWADNQKPVAVLDISNTDALVEQVKLAISNASCAEETFTSLALAALNSLGIIPKRKSK